MWFVILSASEKKNKLATFVISLSALTLWSSFGVRSAWSSASVSETLLTQSNFDLRFPADLPLASRQACGLSFHTKQELFLCNNEKLRKKIESRDQKWMSAFEEVFSHHCPLNAQAKLPALCALQGCEVFSCASRAELAVLLVISFCCVSSWTQLMVKLYAVFQLAFPCWTSPCLQLLYFLSTFSFS